MSTTRLWGLLFPAAVWLCALSCSGGGTPLEPEPTAATVQLTIGDAPVDELASFRVTVTSTRLVRGDGTASEDLLEEPRRVDLLDLRTRSCLLRVANVPTGTYRGAEVTIDANSIEARDQMGALVPVTVTSPVLIVPLPQVELTEGELAQLHVDVDLDRSLTGTSQTGMTFSPTGSIVRRHYGETPLDEVYGRVIESRAAARQLLVDVLARSRIQTLGRLLIDIPVGTPMFDDEGQPYLSEAAFFADAEGAEVEAHGSLLSGGSFRASALEIEDDDANEVEIEGTVVAIDQSTSQLRMRIRGVSEGAQTVNATLGSATELDVSFAFAELFIRRPSPRPAVVAELEVGQHIEVAFDRFETAPFVARSIEIEDHRAQFQGIISNTSDLPNSFTMRLDANDPSLTSGSVASPTTDVVVELGGAERIYLKLNHEPVVGTAALFGGMQIRVRGSLSGPSHAPEIDAEDIRIRPGRLDGTLIGGNSVTLRALVAYERVDEPFGTQLARPMLATIASGAQVRGAAQSPHGIFALAATIEAGESIELRVLGIADRSGGVFAHEIVATVK